MKVPRRIVAEALCAVGASSSIEEVLLDVFRPKAEKGDVAYRTFRAAKEAGLRPQEVALEMAERLSSRGFFASATGPFVNVRFTGKGLATEILPAVLEQGKAYGSSKSGTGKVVVIDYSAPNIGKPLHVGHIRSTILGDSIKRILQFTGHEVHGINYLGDVGLHIGKIVAAYDRWGGESDLELAPEQVLLNLYVRYSRESEEDESLKESAREVLQRIENGDPSTLKLLTTIRKGSLAAFDRVYDLLDVSFDETVGQSAFSERGKQIVEELLAKGIAQREKDGGVVVPLDGLPKKAVLRNDGTAIYATQDIGAAAQRFAEHNFDSMLYVVAKEQALYFKQLFGILEKGGYAWAKDCSHVSFGMIHLPEGKMSTREGNIVSLEELLEKASDLASEHLEKRGVHSRETAVRIGVGAVKHMVLGIDYERDLSFDWTRALDFSGDSAPYVQYGHVRAARLLEHAGNEPSFEGDYAFDSPVERALILAISDFPDVVERTVATLKPHHLATYAFETTRIFSKYYEQTQIMTCDAAEDQKLALVASYKQTIENAYALLGIKMPRAM